MRRKLPAFDVLVDMARNHPERLEALRAKMSQDIIDNAKDEQQKKRLAGLQFQVDMERKRARTPLQATIRISEMMCQSLAELHKSMVTPLVDEHGQPTKAQQSKTQQINGKPTAAPEGAEPAPVSNIIEFRARAVVVEED